MDQAISMLECRFGHVIIEPMLLAQPFGVDHRLVDHDGLYRAMMVLDPPEEMLLESVSRCREFEFVFGGELALITQAFDRLVQRRGIVDDHQGNDKHGGGAPAEFGSGIA